MKRIGVLLASALLSGVLLAFALPPHGWAPLAWIAYVPTLLAVRDRGFAAGFASGLLISLLAAFIDASGFLLGDNLPEGTTEWIYTGFTLFGLASGFALGVWGASERLRAKPWIMAAWAVLFEAALLLYLPAHMALSQSRSTAMLLLASWVGIWGISYLVWLANFWIASSSSWQKRTAIAVACALLSMAWLPAQQGDLKLAMIQTTVSDEEGLSSLNEGAGKAGAHISVWPELSGLLMVMDGNTADLQKIAKSAGQPPFVTSFEEPANPKPFNVARLFHADGVSDGYQKRKPFAGETLIHGAGTKAVSATLAGTTYGMNICFDSCFPAVMRDSARLEDVDVILLPTLDPVTSYGVIQAIHAEYTPFRAAELGIPIVRSDITAHSMAVDACGRVIEELGKGEQVGIANVLPGKRWTFVTFAGDWFLYLCCGLVVLSYLRREPERLLPV